VPAVGEDGVAFQGMLGTVSEGGLGRAIGASLTRAEVGLAAHPPHERLLGTQKPLDRRVGVDQAQALVEDRYAHGRGIQHAAKAEGFKG
jgi:hypothetical protein